MKTNSDIPKILSANLFPVVGIGASAGGLEAFKRFLKALPENSGMAYVLVQHLDPSHESILPQLLQKVTKIPVLEISDDLQVLPNHIYIIPSNKMLVANDGVLLLSPRPEKGKNQLNLPIDLFFTSLAEVHQTFAIGIVLSGLASDGTMGLMSIKDHGGVTFAQDELSATYEGMPKNAVRAGVVDFIMPPEEMPEKLLEIKKLIHRSDEELENYAQQDEDVYKQILEVLWVRKETDFTYYKQSTIRRRILRRMALNKNVLHMEYLKYLQDNKSEQDALYQDILIPVTRFFRDEKIFENLCETVFPHLLIHKNTSDPIRVWVAACSTGQEAFSIAICLKEFLGNRPEKAQIFATDISESAIAYARAGIYTKAEVGGISPARLHEFFTPHEQGYQVIKEIREMCVFANHNFLKDPPFGRIDFVSCRNVLIYMQPYLQKKALTTFHYSLNQKGILLLGKSETSSPVPELFTAMDNKIKLFSRKEAPGRFMHTATPRMERKQYETSLSPKVQNPLTDFQKTADEIILQKYTPAGVVVNELMEIVHYRGLTGNFLEPSPGKPSHNLLKMAKNGLAFELRNILHKVKKANVTVVKDGIKLMVEGGERLISLEAMPLPNVVEPHYLILFHDKHITPVNKDTQAGAKTESGSKRNEKDIQIQDLEKELLHTRDDMRKITEDQEAANEELQSANEELLSGSEELQSLNEELETSKEELQSSNEELSSLNEQVTVAKLYAESIIATIREPMLVLDKALRIKTANKSFYEFFKCTEPNTESVLIYDFGNKQWNLPSLRKLLEEMLPQKKEIRDYEIELDVPSIGSRTLVLNAIEINGGKEAEKLILITLEDITDRKQLEEQKTKVFLRFENLILQAPVAICILRGQNYVVELANRFYLQLVDRDQEFIGKALFESLPELNEQGIKELLDKVMKTGNPFYGSEIELSIERRNKKEKSYFNFVYQPIKESDETVTGIIVVVTEVTDQVIARKRMEAQALMVQNLLMTAPGFVCTLKGPDHVYDMVNERYQGLFGKRNIQGKAMMEALPELEGQGFDLLLDKVYTTGEPYVGIDIMISLARDEGLAPEDRYFNFSYQPIYDEFKHIYSILVFGYEVTDQVNIKNKNLELEKRHGKELEEKIKLRTRELSESNQMLLKKNEALRKMNLELESFSYVSSHDLQEPLRKIQTFSARILEKEFQNLSETGKDYFNRMNKAALRMQTLIEDLLTYSHTSSAERKLENKDLNEVLEEVKADLAEIILSKNAVIEASQLGELHINPFQFRQVMNNLIANALKFCKEDTPLHLTIQTSIATGNEFQDQISDLQEGKLSPHQKYCCISFSDNGIGFDPQYKNKIFDVFQRLHGSEYSGTGIGLSIVKKIVENHNGLVTATGELNKGASFQIYIPVI